VHVYRFASTPRRVAAAFDAIAAGADVERAAAVKAAGYTHDGDHTLGADGAVKVSHAPLVVMATSRPEIRAAAAAGAKQHGLVLCDFW